MSSEDLEPEKNFKVVDVAYNIAAMTGQFWGGIFASIVNVSSSYANVTYNCAKIAKYNFHNEVDPAVKNMMDKINESDSQTTENNDNNSKDN